MTFAFLIFLAAFGIEAIGTYVSVIGLSAIFAANPIVIVLSVALDFAKVMTVSFLYKYWENLKWTMKTYMSIAAVVLMIITSAGTFGFLSGEFQKAIADTGTQTIKIQTLEEEKGRLQKRKEEIDAQIAKLPDSNVRGRTQLIKQFGPEVNRLNERLAVIDKDLPELKIQNVDKEVHVGPIIYIAKAFNTTPEEAVKWVILTIIFVFDPLGVALLIAGNFLLNKRNMEKASTPDPKPEFPSLEEFHQASLDNLDHDKLEKLREERQEIIDRINATPSEAGPLELVPIDPPIIEPSTEEPIVVEGTMSEEDITKILEQNHEEGKYENVTLASIENDPVKFNPSPDCDYCGGDGVHQVGPGEFMDCEACTPTIELEQTPEPTHSEPPKARGVTMHNVDGRDVIALELPTPALDKVNVKLADIEPIDGAHGQQTMKLRNHYSDEITIEPIITGAIK